LTIARAQIHLFPTTRLEFSGQDAVCDGGSLGGWADVVDAEDVDAAEDSGYVGRGGGVEACICWGWHFVEDGGEVRSMGERVTEKAFAGGSDQDGQVKSVELVKIREQRVVFVEAFAEAEAGVEDDFVAWDAGGRGGFEALG
jgi:hypothetical protein